MILHQGVRFFLLQKYERKDSKRVSQFMCFGIEKPLLLFGGGQIVMQIIKKWWLLLLPMMAFILSHLPNWLPEDARYHALKVLASYKAPVLITAILSLFIFRRKQGDCLIEKKYFIRDTMCRVHIKSKAAFHNPNLITTVVRCAKDGARFKYHSDRDRAEYLCTICRLRLPDDEYNKCKNEAESMFVREHDPLNKPRR